MSVCLDMNIDIELIFRFQALTRQLTATTINVSAPMTTQSDTWATRLITTAIFLSRRQDLTGATRTTARGPASSTANFPTPSMSL